jgi:hypothetical protein
MKRRPMSITESETGTPKNPGPLINYVVSGFMPPGRKLDQPEKDKLVDYLKALK